MKRLLLGVMLIFGASIFALDYDGGASAGTGIAGRGSPESNSVTIPLKPVKVKKHRSKDRVQASGVTGRKIEESRNGEPSSSDFARWKMRLPFWWRKILIFVELALFIIIGVILGQMLEVGGVIKYIAVLTKPLLWLGDLPSAAGTPFIMSLQSGAVANSMLVNCRDEGELSNRQLYTSVLVVSCLSLFAHLPTFILPLGLAFGREAALLFFAVRFGAIFFEVLLILLFSRGIVRRITGDPLVVIAQEERLHTEFKTGQQKQRGYFITVWLRSRRTIRRLLLFLLPSFFIMVFLEYYGTFDWLAAKLPQLFSYSFLPAQAAAIIPAQAVNLYNGAIAAGNFVDEGAITPVQAVLILLCGSLITSPVRTLKHALPTYIAVLGPKTGTVMAFAAQILRLIFVGGATALVILFFS